MVGGRGWRLLFVVCCLVFVVSCRSCVVRCLLFPSVALVCEVCTSAFGVLVFVECLFVVG